MPIEHYNLDDINIILQAFNLPAQPYVSRKNLPAHIYFRKVDSTNDINLFQDTLDYVRQVLNNRGQFVPERKVAFLFEFFGNKVAVIVSYENLLIENIEKIIAQANWEAILAAQFKTIYKSINIECVAPTHTQQFLFGCLRPLKLPIRMHTLVEDSGVTLTESILMLLFRNRLFPTNLQQIFDHQRNRCEQQLVGWLAELQKTKPQQHQEILRLLAIVIKFTLLEAQQSTLLGMADFLIHNENFKKHFFALPLGDIAAILPHLPLTGITYFLRLRHNPQELIAQLEAQRGTQEKEIQAREQQAAQMNQPVSWGQWMTQSLVRAPKYCYERSYINLGAQIVPWLMQQITPTSIATPLESVLQRILLLIKELFRFVPENLRPLGLQQLTHQNTLATFNSCMGAGLGLLLMYYAGIFEILFSLGLIFLTEFCHDRLAAPRVDLPSATIIPRVSSVTSLTTLLRLNTLLILLLISLYTYNFDYLKRAATAIGVSEIVRRLFIKFSSEFDLTAEESSYCEFILTQCGMQFGDFIYSTYTNVQCQIITRDQVVAELSHLANHVDGYAEVPNLWLRPWRWLTGYNPFDFFWRDDHGRYHAQCEIVNDNPGFKVDCRIVASQRYQPMLDAAK